MDPIDRNKFSLGDRLLSFRHAFRGIFFVIRSQHNFRIHLVFVVLVVLAGFLFSISLSEWLVLMLTIALVLSLEMINSAIEYLVDLVTKEHHPLAGKVKDIAAGAVLVAAIISVIIGLIIFIPKICSL